MNLYTKVRIIVLLLLFNAWPAAFAKDYIVEMIFFADASGASAGSLHISTQPIIPDLQA